MSRDSYSHLKRYLTERGGGPVPRIIHDRLYLYVYEGVPRTRSQVLATAGAQEGDAPKQGIERALLWWRFAGNHHQ